MTENIYVLNGLKRKRGEVAGQIMATERNLKALYADLAAVDRALVLMDPTAVPALIKPVKVKQRFRYYRSGELPRMILNHLRTAGEPIPHYVLVDAMMAAKQLDPKSRPLREAVERRVRAALQRMESKQIARRIGVGRESQWALNTN